MAWQGRNTTRNANRYESWPSDSIQWEANGLKKVIYDRGGKGRSKIRDTQVLTPSSGSSQMSGKEKKILRQLFRSRAAIEPTIGHLKSDFGLDRNFLSGTLGDALNALMAGAAYNFRIRLREIRALIFYTWEGLYCLIKCLASPILGWRWSSSQQGF